ncbi:pleckstrin y domain-containing family M member 3 [Caerostris extrusa]|uniref:Pleckstrin y domain-containing family M member 3 n=1 Tax=Caerostris extrusa TaxID=172846 RepID=A0AAV4WAY4_CAEEX|nr:pleckstrin y domain-containing family M member 3 [Caerostris extrusa]
MLSDTSSLQKHYNSSAYLRDDEQADIMKKLLEGLNVFTFELSCNNSSLNVWNSVMLTLADIWSPPVTPQPVMPAVDVIDFFTDPKNQTKSSPKVKKTTVVECCPANDVAGSSGDNSTDIKSDIKPLVDDSKPTEESLPASKITIEAECENITKDASPISDSLLQNQDDLKYVDQNLEEMSSNISSSDSVPDFGFEITDDLSYRWVYGHKLCQHTGWSSSLTAIKILEMRS